jgi:pyruvate,orthophosphate dikinase
LVEKKERGNLTMDVEKKMIWFFGIGKTEGGKELNHILGNKGAQLCEMSKIGIPVPPGFVISTRAAVEYFRYGSSFMKKIEGKVKDALLRLSEFISKIRGKDFPLLLSVRSGAVVSMPGMMDTILNVGMNKKALEYFKKIDERFAYDTYRRFIQMFSSIALGIPRSIFEQEFEKWKKSYELYKEGIYPDFVSAYYSLKDGFEKSKLTDRELPAEVLEKICDSYLSILKQRGIELPEDIFEQVMLSVEAVFRSWNSERAIAYRRIHNIPDDLGTAANVVAMVFGNMGDDSGTGVLFTRNPNTGEKYLYGNFLTNAQGEDVVAGIRTPYAINDESKNEANKNFPTMKELMPSAYKELEKIAEILERHYKDMQDVEFTIERKKVWILQTRTGKRTARAHIKIVHDMLREKKLNENEALKRITPQHLKELFFSVVDEEKLNTNPITRGLPASPGVVSGKVAFSSAEAEDLAKQGVDVILVRHETSPEDIKGIASAKGILTSRGGETSHAAVVARAMGKPAVVGAEEIIIDYQKQIFSVGDIVVSKGEVITIDGNTGRVFVGTIPIRRADFPPEAQALLKIADKIRTLGVRANADTPEESQTARNFGAEGIGLLRTEHMFFEEERIPLVRKMIIAARKYKEKLDELKNIIDNLVESTNSAPEVKKIQSGLNYMRLYPRFERGKKSDIFFDDLKNFIESNSQNHPNLLKVYQELLSIREDYFETLRKIKVFIKSDFLEIFSVMEGFPVTVRLIDPPLHEFLPKTDEEIKDTAQKTGMSEDEIRETVKKLSEVNPMLGHRGIRVGITYPEIYCMQTEAILEACSELIRKGKKVLPEIMFPNVIDPAEIRYFRNVVDMIKEDLEKESGIRIPLSVGTMMEFPRACLLSAEIARYVDFMSFGTNDLTQTVLGISRDDSGKFMSDYVPFILSSNPFNTLDVAGVGEMIKLAVSKARSEKPKIKIGVCGEHGGDPESIKFLHSIGFNYVSASPYRVPIARLVAAQAAIDQKQKSVSFEITKEKKKALKSKSKPKKSSGAKKEGKKEITEKSKSAEKKAKQKNKKKKK